MSQPGVSAGSAAGELTYRLEIQYDGGGFHGWAKQPGLPTVEGVLEEAFLTLTGSRPRLIVAGRTDAGVHARRQVISVSLPGVRNPERLARSLDALTPEGVGVLALGVASRGFNARRDATRRVYRYFIVNGRFVSPFMRRFAWHIPQSLDLAAMRDAAAAVRGRHDFTAFTPTVTEHAFFLRTVAECHWDDRDGLLVLTVAADGFLRQMVRSLVGTMVEVGRGGRKPEEMAQLLRGAPRGASGVTAPSHGLFLWDIIFPGNDERRAIGGESHSPFMHLCLDTPGGLDYYPHLRLKEVR